MRSSRNVSITSILSYIQVRKSGQDLTEKQKVLELLIKQGPSTSRQITNIASLERTNVTRSLADLLKLELVRIEKIDRCQTTNRLVQYYGLNTKKGTVQ